MTKATTLPSRVTEIRIAQVPRTGGDVDMLDMGELGSLTAEQMKEAYRALSQEALDLINYATEEGSLSEQARIVVEAESRLRSAESSVVLALLCEHLAWEELRLTHVQRDVVNLRKVVNAPIELIESDAS